MLTDNYSAIQCIKGHAAQLYCKSLNCPSFVFICDHADCQCHRQHQGCPPSLQEPVQKLKRMLLSFQEANQSSNISSTYLDPAVLLYQQLQKRIAADKSQLLNLRKKYAKLSEELDRLRDSLYKREQNRRFDGEDIFIIECFLQVTLKAINQRCNTSQTLSKLEEDISNRIQVIKEGWSFLGDLELAETEENYKRGLQVYLNVKCDKDKLGLSYSCNSQRCLQYFYEKQNQRMKEWKNTERVNITRQKLQGILQRYPRLQSVNLRKNHLHNEHLAVVINHLKLLTAIDISHNNISSEGIIALCEEYPNLRSLQCQGNAYNPITQSEDESASYRNRNCVYIDDEAMKGLVSLEFLQCLNIADNAITAAGMQSFGKGKFEHLASLNVSSNKIGDQGAISIGKNLRSIKVLNISSCHIGDIGLAAIAQGVEKLEDLCVESNRVTDEGVQTLSWHQRSLAILKMDNKNQISDRGLKEICMNLSGLRVLDFNVSQITKSGIVYLSKLRQAERLPEFTSNEGSFDVFVKLSRNAKAHISVQSAREIHWNPLKRVFKKRLNQRNFRLISRRKK